MSINEANKTCLQKIQESTAVWSDIRTAKEVIPGMTERTVLHAGPPVSWENMCGPMRGSITGACLYEGWASTPEEVEALAVSGELEFDSSHHRHAIGPMSGIITPSMEVNVVTNTVHNIETYIWE